MDTMNNMKATFQLEFPALNFEDLEEVNRQTYMKHKVSGEIFVYNNMGWKIVDATQTEKQKQQHWYDMITRHFC